VFGWILRDSTRASLVAPLGQTCILEMLAITNRMTNTEPISHEERHSRREDRIILELPICGIIMRCHAHSA
jgi:hypothetical protein